MGGVGATLGNGYEIQGQNYVARLQERVLWVCSRYRNFMLGIWCFRWIIPEWLSGLMGSKADSRFGNLWSLHGRLDFSIFDTVNPLRCWLLRLNRGARGEHLPAFMSGCLTISNMCLPCLLSERRLLFWRCLFVVGREVSWKAPLSSMIIFTVSISLQIILHGGTFFIFYFWGVTKLGALYNIDFRVYSSVLIFNF